eukprot:Hpha_TRINITY_DN15791_c7_g3::TRINITY_DN15791_c7_g3_i1::g.41567::m.41567
MMVRGGMFWIGISLCAAVAAEDCEGAVRRCFGSGLRPLHPRPLDDGCVTAVLDACGSRARTYAAEVGECSKCPFTNGSVCCNPTAKPAQKCPGDITCCDCGSSACLCSSSPSPPPPSPSPPTPPPAPTP